MPDDIAPDDDATTGSASDPEAAPEATDPSPSPSPAPSPSPRSSRSVSLRSVAVGAVVVAVLVAAVAVALTQRSRVGDLEDERDARTEVTAAAARFAETYLSYDFDDPEGTGERVTDLVTPEFAADFESNRAPGVEELFANLGTTTTAETTEVFVGDVDDTSARALVVVDVEATSEASGTQQLTDLTFVLSFVREGDQWLVDEVLPAPQPDVSGDGVDDTTTTTAAP